MNDSNENLGIVEEVKKAMTDDVEVPMDKKVAGSTFSLIALFYMAVLVGAAILLSLILWASGLLSEPETDAPVRSPPSAITFVPPLS